MFLTGEKNLCFLLCCRMGHFEEVIGEGGFVVVGLGLDAMLAEEAGDTLLQFGCHGIASGAVAVEVGTAAEDVIELFSEIRGLSGGDALHDARHAAGDADRFGGCEEAALITLTCGGQHGDVMGEGRGCQLRYGMAQAAVAERTVVLEADGPVAGRIFVGKFLHHTLIYYRF